MKILGIIAEYNPLHNGHLYHLKEAQKIKPDLTIVIITSTFNSRGEISLLSSTEKTKLLLNNNVDIVIELPFILGVQSADIFALKSIEILNKFNVTHIISGSEKCDLNYIKQLDELSNSTEYNMKIKELLKSGQSYKMASNEAFSHFNIHVPNSNDVLNWKYYSSIKKINNSIILDFVKREKSQYLDKVQSDKSICSATSIRETNNYKNYVPTEVECILNTKGITNHNPLDNYIVFCRNINSNLSDIYFMDEGLDNAFLKSQKNSFDEIARELTSSRYTTTRIRRALLQILFSIKRNEAIHSLDECNPRVLGFNSLGQKHLNSLKKEVNFFTNLRSNINITYDIEIKVLKTLSDIYRTDLFKESQKLPIIKNDTYL